MSDPEQPRTTLTLAQVVESYHATRRLETALAAYGTTAFQLAMLTAIAAAPGVCLRDIARIVGVIPTVLSIGLDRLERQGLVLRVMRRSPQGPADRRCVAVDLTDRGRDLLASLVTIEIEG